MVKAAKGALLATLEVDRNSGAPIYRQIEDFLRQMILNGALPPSKKLPSTRELALELGVSRITIKSVYEQLISEGYVQGKIGAGTFVSEGLDSETPVVPSLDSVKKDYFDGKTFEYDKGKAVHHPYQEEQKILSWLIKNKKIKVDKYVKRLVQDI